jgi:hypothetical protein
MSRRSSPRLRALPRAGVLRLHYDPAALPKVQGQIGHNRFDDPRVGTINRYVVRYTASTLRGCLLESLAWLRPSPEADAREAAVIDDAEPDGSASPGVAREPRAALQDFLEGRHVGRLAGRNLRVVSINDSALQAELDLEPAVRALLDSREGQLALASGGGRVPRLDEAAVQLATPFGRDLSRACSLAVWDRVPRPDGIHHRSRHDDHEHCWALFDHARVRLVDRVPFLPGTDPDQRWALQEVAALWDLSLPPAWSVESAELA